MVSEHFDTDTQTHRHTVICRLNIPGRAMRFPWAQTYPAELSFAVLVPTNHVIAASIFLNSHMAFRTLLLEEEENGESTDWP